MPPENTCITHIKNGLAPLVSALFAHMVQSDVLQNKKNEKRKGIKGRTKTARTGVDLSLY